MAPDVLCYNELTVEEEMQPETDVTQPATEAPSEPAAPPDERSLAEARAKRILIGGGIGALLLLLLVAALLVFLSVSAYQAAVAGTGPTPGSIVVGLLRDAAIVFVAFETLVIGVLLIVLMLQVQSLVVLLRDEIGPMLKAVNETVATVRGTTKFVSQSVVSPVMKWSGYLSGAGRILRDIAGLRRQVSGDDDQDTVGGE